MVNEMTITTMTTIKNKKGQGRNGMGRRGVR
jgi:hypothetical protein